MSVSSKTKISLTIAALILAAGIRPAAVHAAAPPAKGGGTTTITCDETGVTGSGQAGCTSVSCHLNIDGSTSCDSNTELPGGSIGFHCENLKDCSGDVKMELGDLLTQCHWDSNGNCQVNASSSCGAMSCTIQDGNITSAKCSFKGPGVGPGGGSGGPGGGGGSHQGTCTYSRNRVEVKYVCTLPNDNTCTFNGGYDDGHTHIGGGFDSPNCSVQVLYDDQGHVTGTVTVCHSW